MPQNGVRSALSRQDRLTAFQSGSQTPQSAGQAQRAACALATHGEPSLSVLHRHPGFSKSQLAEEIGNGINVIGLTMMLFEEAHQRSQVKELAMDLLYRKIIEEFPNGWRNDDSLGATFRIGGWHYDVSRHAPECSDSATAIIKALKTSHRPREGWLPLSVEDPQLVHLFTSFWKRIR